MTAAAKGSDAMHDPIGTAAVGARSRPAGATGPRRAGTAFLGGLWAARAVRGWLALILLSGALATGACTLPDEAPAPEAISVPAAAPPEAGATLLHMAAGFGSDPYMIKALIEAGADPDARAEEGATPLHLAAGRANPSVVKALIEGGADSGARSEGGLTPLHMAAYNNANPFVIKALIEGGANPAARDEDGFTPFDYAKDNEALKGTDAYWLLNEGRFE